MVPGEIGILPEYREGYRNPPGAKWAMMGLSGKEKRQPYMGHKGEEEGRPGQAARPLPPSPNRTRRGGRRPPSFLPSTFSPFLS